MILEVSLKGVFLYVFVLLKGAGTRKGSGDCSCNPGYGGEMCDSCTYGYYQAYKDESKILCEKCNKACNGPCSGVSIFDYVFICYFQRCHIFMPEKLEI